VVLWIEFEVDSIANLGLDVFRREYELVKGVNSLAVGFFGGKCGHTAAVPFSAFPTTTRCCSADTREVAARRIAATENFMFAIYPWEWYSSCGKQGAIKVPGRDTR
jgi:hypothetical protein